MADSYYEDTYNGNSIHFGGRKSKFPGRNPETLVKTHVFSFDNLVNLEAGNKYLKHMYFLEQ